MRSTYPEYILRFFNRKGAYWPYEIHSRPSHRGPAVKIPAKRTDLAFIHLANEDMHTLINKINKYTDQEKERRRKKYRPVKFLYDPAFRFFKRYVLKGAFRDGLPGFIYSVNEAIYRYLILAKLEEERETAKSDKDIERDLRITNIYPEK